VLVSRGSPGIAVFRSISQRSSLVRSSPIERELGDGRRSADGLQQQVGGGVVGALQRGGAQVGQRHSLAGLRRGHRGVEKQHHGVDENALLHIANGSSSRCAKVRPDARSVAKSPT
jgi:hypothetical protein